MWDELCEKYNGGIKVSYTDSFYVGDAAGRALGWKPGAPKDFSAGDRMFAHNVGLPFHTPEEYFLGEDKASFSWGHVNPSEIVSKLERAKTKPFTAPMITSSSQEIIVMVGFPASGKSSFVKKYLAPKGYERVNRDTLGTQEKCVSVAASALASGKSVVVGMYPLAFA
jgi:bifunctional polynucleotide phosphatase/kinase